MAVCHGNMLSLPVASLWLQKTIDDTLERLRVQALARKETLRRDWIQREVDAHVAINHGMEKLDAWADKLS